MTSQNTKEQVLIIEDDTEIAKLLSLLLSKNGYEIIHTVSSQKALELLKEKSFDLITLDWMLPDISGVEFLNLFRKTNNKTPVLMLTAKANSESVVEGLDAGADDYVTKPFEPDVLLARVNALLRRSNQKSVETATLKLEEISIDLNTYEVLVSGNPVHLTISEFKILVELVKNKGKVLTRQYLISNVQGDGITVTGRTVDTHVFSLRKKLDSSSHLIETIRGVGYRVKID